MNMKNKYFLYQVIVITCLTAVTFLNGCGGGGGNSENNSGSDFTVEVDKVDEQVLLLQFIGNQFMLPGYSNFQQQTAELYNASETFCSASSPGNIELDNLRNQWMLTMDAWQMIQIMRFGPVSNNNYQIRIQFFPDSNNAIINNVGNILSSNDSIDEQLVASSSVGSQGLPAIEYLIFGDNTQIISDFTSQPDSNKRCQLLNSITSNLNTIANDLVNGWSASGEDFINDFMGTGLVGSGDTSLIDEMLSDMVNSLIEQAQFILLSKLEAPLGQNTSGNSEAAESWRSQYSLQNLTNNFQAFKSVYGNSGDGFSRYLNEVVEANILDTNMQSRIATIQQMLNQISAPLVSAIDETEQRQLIENLIAEMELFIAKLEGDFASAMNATIGFNGNDGD